MNIKMNLQHKGIYYDQATSVEHKFKILSRSWRPLEATIQVQLCFTLSVTTF